MLGVVISNSSAPPVEWDRSTKQAAGVLQRCFLHVWHAEHTRSDTARYRWAHKARRMGLILAWEAAADCSSTRDCVGANQEALWVKHLGKKTFGHCAIPHQQPLQQERALRSILALAKGGASGQSVKQDTMLASLTKLFPGTILTVFLRIRQASVIGETVEAAHRATNLPPSLGTQ